MKLRVTCDGVGSCSRASALPSHLSRGKGSTVILQNGVSCAAFFTTGEVDRFVVDHDPYRVLVRRLADVIETLRK